MGENSGDVEATGTFYVHEETVGGLNQSFELVLALLVSERWVAKVLWHTCDLVCSKQNNNQNN